MRRALAFTLLAFVLAGCTSGTSDDDPAPPNADPNGMQTLPPAGSSSASTGPPTGLPSSSNSTSASGTASPPASGPVSFAGHDEEDTTTDEGFPSLLVSGRLQGSGPQVRVEATANNMGERAYRIPDGNCSPPWTESMRGPEGQLVNHRQPGGICGAFGLKEFPAHDFTSTALTWDGLLRDSYGNTFPAPSGTYVWEVVFHVYSGGTGAQFDDHAALTLRFDVHVP